jgi:hypothetical protein
MQDLTSEGCLLVSYIHGSQLSSAALGQVSCKCGRTPQFGRQTLRCLDVNASSYSAIPLFGSSHLSRIDKRLVLTC